MANRTLLDICIRAHEIARKRNRLDMIYGKISTDQFRARAARIAAAYDKRWRQALLATRGFAVL